MRKHRCVDCVLGRNLRGWRRKVPPRTRLLPWRSGAASAPSRARHACTGVRVGGRETRVAHRLRAAVEPAPPEPTPLGLRTHGPTRAGRAYRVSTVRTATSQSHLLRRHCDARSRRDPVLRGLSDRVVGARNGEDSGAHQQGDVAEDTMFHSFGPSRSWTQPQPQPTCHRGLSSAGRTTRTW